MRKIIQLAMLSILVLIGKNLVAQETSNQGVGQQYFEMGEYFRWGTGIRGKKDFTKALESYQKSASMNTPDGIMAVGEMYLEGLAGLEKDFDKAYGLFQDAFQKGSGRACYNLGKCHAYGLGCEMDYDKMIFYLNEGINRSDPPSMYALGDMHYKGWGVEQSYEKAVKYFEQGSSLGSEPARYYLGVCYRNGYGVGKDEAKGRELLKEASRTCLFAGKELKESEPEIERSKKIKTKELDSPGKYSKMNHSISIETIEGSWLGEITIYDWSGQYKLEQIPVSLKFETVGDQFNATGVCGGEPITLKGFNNQNGILFSSGEFKYVDHFYDDVALRIETGSFQSYTKGSKIILAGNISLFSVTRSEPERPAYLVITKDKREKAEKSQEVIGEIIADTVHAQEHAQSMNVSGSGTNTVGDSQMQEPLLDYLQKNQIESRVWPIPFQNTLNLEYKLIKEGETEIKLFTVEGKLVKILMVETKKKGTHRQQFNIAVPPGIYLLQVSTNNHSKTHRIIKRN